MSRLMLSSVWPRSLFHWPLYSVVWRTGARRNWNGILLSFCIIYQDERSCPAVILPTAKLLRLLFTGLLSTDCSTSAALDAVAWLHRIHLARRGTVTPAHLRRGCDQDGEKRNLGSTALSIPSTTKTTTFPDGTRNTTHLNWYLERADQRLPSLSETQSDSPTYPPLRKTAAYHLGATSPHAHVVQTVV